MFAKAKLSLGPRSNANPKANPKASPKTNPKANPKTNPKANPKANLVDAIEYDSSVVSFKILLFLIPFLANTSILISCLANRYSRL